MPEDQNIEYKQSWQEDNLKTVCALANTNGGKLYIGKDDNGNNVGLVDYADLIEVLPNRIKK